MTYQPPQQPGPGQFPQQGQPQPYYAQPGQQPMYYGQPPKRKKRLFQRVWFWLAIIAVLGVGGCTAIVAVFVNAVDEAVNAEHTVVYQVTGDGTTSSITYTSFNGDGSSGTEQQGEAPLPFTKELVGKGDFSVYSLVAQASDGTTISCSITIDGTVVVEQTSTGQYSVVTCAGSPPDDLD